MTTTRPELTARDRGLGAALEIQFRHEPRQWRAEVDRIEDPDVKAVAENYLRGILQRMKAARIAGADNRRR